MPVISVVVTVFSLTYLGLSIVFDVPFTGSISLDSPSNTCELAMILTI